MFFKGLMVKKKLSSILAATRRNELLKHRAVPLECEEVMGNGKKPISRGHLPHSPSSVAFVN